MNKSRSKERETFNLNQREDVFRSHLLNDIELH